MHPFLKSPLYMLLMGLLWSPVIFCAVILERGLSGLSFIESLILIGPAIVLEVLPISIRLFRTLADLKTPQG